MAFGMSLGLSGSVASTLFTALHLYYMSPTGNDANNGLTPATAWATPNHAVVCGDVIIAAAGSYTNQFENTFSSPSSCPSTTGGIDGTGGIWFVTILCAGPDLESCQASDNTGDADGSGVFSWNTTGQNNWAIEGFKINGQANWGVGIHPRSNNNLHHLAQINDIVYNASRGYNIDPCPAGSCNTAAATDYWAVVGSIAQNANQSSICLAAFDAVSPGQIDSNPGTHIYFYGNFGIANLEPACNSISDGEAFMFDTWDAYPANYQGVVANNIAYDSTRMGMQLFQQDFNHSTAHSTIKIYNNTFYSNLQHTGTDSADGEIVTESDATVATSFVVSVTNNITMTSGATSPGGGNDIYALTIGTPNITNGWGSNLTVTGNVFKGFVTGCGNSQCTIAFFNGNSDPSASNTLTDPLFVNATDIINNHVGVPNCAGYASVTACMGYNPTNQGLRTSSIIADLQARCAQCSGKGYQLPSTTCAPNADYPTWLKGIVRLQWHSNNSTITEESDLVTKPCGM